MRKRSASSYRKHAAGKSGRKMHAKRLKRRKVKYDGLAAFAYDCGLGKGPRAHRLSKLR